MSSIQWHSSPLLIALCILIALIVTGILYYKSNKFEEQSTFIKVVLPSLRFLSLLGILLLLLDPFIKTVTNQEIKPILVVAKDASESMGLKADHSLINNSAFKFNSDFLEGKYDVHTYNFDQVVHSSMDSTFIGQGTNISALFKQVEDQFKGRNIAGLVMLSDGIFNQGTNPIYEIGNLNVPIYSIAFGDTIHEKDLFINNVFYNETVLLNDAFEVQVDVSSINLEGTKSKIRIERISPMPEKLVSKAININSEDYFSTEKINILANSEGVQHYRVSLTPVAGEKNSRNNYKDFYVEVIDSKTQILLLAKSPHPDVAMLNRIVEKSKNHEIEIKYLKDIEELQAKKYDLVIYHDLPSPLSSFKSFHASIKNAQVPYIFMIGPHSDINLFNREQSVIEIFKGSNQNNFVGLSFENKFQLFLLDDIQKFRWGGAPPLKSVFGEIDLKLGAEAILYQRIGAIDTEYPLMAIHDKPYKHAVITGVDWWKLRMYEFLQTGEQEKLDLLFLKLIQYLALQEDKSPFKLKGEKKLYNSNESVTIRGALHNANYELVNTADIAVTISDSDKKTYQFLMDRSNDSYSLDIGSLPAGDYSFNGKCSFGGKKYESSGRFSVKDIQLESFQLQANHDILRQLSSESNGGFYYPSSIDSLKAQLMTTSNSKVLLAEQVKLSQFIDYRILLFIIAFLLFIEWSLRKYYGSY